MEDTKHILDQLPVGVWLGRVPDGTCDYTNAYFELIMGTTGVPGVDIHGAPEAYGIFDLTGKRYPLADLPFSRVLASGQPAVVEGLVIHRPDGRHVHVRAFGVPLYDAQQRLTHVAVAFLDITRESDAVLERDGMQARLALAVDNSPLVVWSADTKGTITMSQGAGLKALGFFPGQLVGQSVFDLYATYPDSVRNIRRGLQGESFWYSTALPGLNYETWITPLRNAQGTIVGVSALSRDVTELHQLQAATIDQDRFRALGALAASVAHEVNNPLTYMVGHLDEALRSLDALQTLSESVPGTAGAVRVHVEALRTSLGPVLEGTRRIARVTGELSTFSRQEETRQPVDLRHVVRSVVGLVGKEVEASARLLLELADVPAVLATEGRLAQVILNLVQNALQALGPGQPAQDRQVVIRTRTNGPDAVLEVTDTGPGVPTAERERVFEPFVTTKGVGGGSGLGLFVCRNIVRAAGGDVTIHDRPGGGALFRVELPAAPRSIRVAPPPAAPTPKPDGQGIRVLIIDDEELVAQVLARQLKRAGYDVVTVGSARQGLELLLGNPGFTLAYCDLMMKDMTGMDLAAALSARAPHVAVRVVFMTGGAFTEAANQFLLANAGCTVAKPFDVVSETRRRIGTRRV